MCWSKAEGWISSQRSCQGDLLFELYTLLFVKVKLVRYHCDIDLVLWLLQLAAVAALCVQYEAEFRPNMSIVVKALQPLLKPPASAAPAAESWSKLIPVFFLTVDICQIKPTLQSLLSWWPYRIHNIHYLFQLLLLFFLEDPWVYVWLDWIGCFLVSNSSCVACWYSPQLFKMFFPFRFWSHQVRLSGSGWCGGNYIMLIVCFPSLLSY